MAKQVQLTPEVIRELEKVGIQEGDTFGGGSTEKFRLSPLGTAEPVTTPDTREPIIVSTKQAETAIDKKKATEDRITPEPKPEPEPEKKEEKPPVGLSADEVSTVTDGTFEGYKKQSDGSYLPETALDVASER